MKKNILFKHVTYSIICCLAFYCMSPLQASIVETFPLLKGADAKTYGSEYYTVGVKSLDDSGEYSEAFTYRRANDFVDNNGDRCYEYENGPTNVHHLYAKLNGDATCSKYDGRGKTPNYIEAEKLMSATNNWATFDVGADRQRNGQAPDEQASGYAKVNIKVRNYVDDKDGSQNYTIRPSHAKAYVTESWKGLVKGKQGESVLGLVLKVAKPVRGEWSGQFHIDFEGTSGGKVLDKNPLFIFANALPKWYYNLANTDDYTGCPADGYYMGEDRNFDGVGDWLGQDSNGQHIGKVVTMSYNNGSAYSRDFLDLSNKFNGDNKQICIPGGTYLRGRFIYSAKSGSPKKENLQGFKVIGRGTLSGELVRHQERLTEGWHGHLIDIRNNGETINGDKVNACYDTQSVNCIEGITMTDSSKANIYTEGTATNVSNVKVMGWHTNTDAIAVRQSSKVDDVFSKVNDDVLHMTSSNVEFENISVWKQGVGSVVQLGWNQNKQVSDSTLTGLYVFEADPLSPFLKGKRNRSLISLQNMTRKNNNNAYTADIDNFLLSNIVVEKQLYQLLSLQLDEGRDGTSAGTNMSVSGITINGLFTPEPRGINNDGKSYISIQDNGQIDGATRNISGIEFNNVCIGNNPETARGLWRETFNNYFSFYDDDGFPYEDETSVGRPYDGSWASTKICASMRPYINGLSSCTQEIFLMSDDCS